MKRFNTKEYASEKKISIQEAARDLRYAWFKEIVDSWEMADDRRLSMVNGQWSMVNCIVTAHHADDNIETLLMHFFRGTGILGMTGIQPELAGRKL